MLGQNPNYIYETNYLIPGYYQHLLEGSPQSTENSSLPVEHPVISVQEIRALQRQ